MRKGLSLLLFVALAATSLVAQQKTFSVWNAFTHDLGMYIQLPAPNQAYINQLTFPATANLVRVEMSAAQGQYQFNPDTGTYDVCQAKWKLAITNGTSTVSFDAPSSTSTSSVNVNPGTSDSGPLNIKIPAGSRLRLFALPGNAECAPPNYMNISITYQ